MPNRNRTKTQGLRVKGKMQKGHMKRNRFNFRNPVVILVGFVDKTFGWAK